MSAPSANRAAIIRPTEQPVADRGGGIRTIPLVTPGKGSRQLINGITVFPPLGEIPLHYHNCEESVTVLEGHAIAFIDGAEYWLEAGDTSWIASNVPHRFRNASDKAQMRILWTYASIEATRTLVATGETRLVAAEHSKDKLVAR